GNPSSMIYKEMAGSLPVPGSICVAIACQRAGDGGVLSDGIKHIAPRRLFPIMRPKKVILCVDDNEQELSVLKFMLATNGYRVVSASTGQEAIGIFAEIQVDLVL